MRPRHVSVIPSDETMMQSVLIRAVVGRNRWVSWVALAAVTLAAQAGPAASGAEVTVPSAQLRLSGVIAVGGETRLAVIEAAGQGGRLVRVGDKLVDGTRVLEIGPDWIRVRKGNIEQKLDINGVLPVSNDAGGPPAAVAAAARPERPFPWEGKASPEVVDAVTRIAADPLASEADLTFGLASQLDLPADARVRPFFPGEEERERKGLAEVGEAIKRGEMVRLMVDTGGVEAAIYIMPGSPAVVRRTQD